MATKLIPTLLGSECVECPPIEPVSEEVYRPLWSVMIPTYNRTKYLEQTLKSVLEQDLGPEVMQIEVIDNCSTENDPETVVRRIGHNRVSFHRQPYNVGLIANLTTCIKRARGHLVHILHDDDVVLPGFYSHLQEAFEKEPTIGAAFCRYAQVDEENRLQYLAPAERSTPDIISDWIERIAVRQRLEPPAIVVRRKVYEQLGGFHPGLSHSTDWEMWKRIAAHYSVWYEPKTLAYYRVHSSSDTSAVVKSGQNIVDTRRAIEVSQSYLPNAIADKLSSKAKENCALWALIIARRALVRGDKATAIVQIQEALKCSSSLRVISSLTLLPLLVGISKTMTTARRKSPQKELSLRVKNVPIN